MNKSTDETAAMDRHDEPYKSQLQRIGQAIGYGRAQPAAPADAAPSVAPEPQTALQRFEVNGGTEDCTPIERLRFFCSLAMNAQDWLDVEAFFDALAANPPRAPLTEEHVTAVVRSVCPNLAETSKAWRDLVVECRYWLEAAHGIGGK